MMYLLNWYFKFRSNNRQHPGFVNKSIARVKNLEARKKEC